MKKIALSAFLVVNLLLCRAQIITTSPTFITNDYSGEIEVTYDATQGTAGLKDYTGTDGVYAHTGVITSASASSSDWKHAPTWGDNSAKYKLTSLGNNKWKLVITPSMAGYYGLSTGEVVKKLVFVFRNGLKTKEGKDTGGTDIFVNVYEPGLNVNFSSPSGDQCVSSGATLNFTISASQASNLALSLNGASVQTASGATTLSYSKTFTATGDYTFIASATLNNTTMYDTLRVCVPEAVSTQARPANVINGINYIDNSTVTLVLHAPNKSNVFVLGDFNDWAQQNAYQMKKDGEYWWITLTGLTPQKIYGYQYLVDGSLRVSDPYTKMVLDPWNDSYISSTIYPNRKPYPVGKTTGVVATFQTAQTAYDWEVPTFTMPSKENMVIYEMLFRDFTPEKSVDAAIARLDYLQKLGVTAVELMPITEFDGNESWGYNPNHYFATDKAYGTEASYKKFIDECHKRGIAVILDMVFNHATGNCPFAALYWDSTNSRPSASNPWMNPTAPHGFSVFNDFNHTSTATREYFKRVLQYWITEYKADGFRLDLGKGFTQNSGTESTYDQSRIDNLTVYYEAAKVAKSDVMFIIEHFCISTEENALAYKGMYLWRNVNNAYSQAAMGYQDNSDFGAMISAPRQWVGYAESHDEERNFYKAKASGNGTISTDSLVRIGRVPINIAFATLIPGPKMIWQFGEMGYDYSLTYGGSNVSNKPSAWGYLNLAHRKAAYEAACKIISLRKKYPVAFTQGTFVSNIGYSDWSGGRRLSLSHSDLKMIVVGNFQAASTITAYPAFQQTGTWHELLTGATLDVTNTAMSLSLTPGEVRIYTDRKIDFANATDTPEADKDCIVYPSVTTGKIFISSSVSVKSIRIFSLQGALIGTSVNFNTVDLSNAANGLYIIEVNTLNGRSLHKIVKE